ncbi:MAG: YbaK/EbsC family protein [Myxococcota bacterium]|nr:YbaK/EbsC family protein [Myxococcota bacterium]
MAIASRLKWFLDVNRVQYDVLPGRSPAAGCPSDDQLVVSHLFHDARGLVMVVLPASHEIALPAVEESLGRSLHPAKPSEVSDIFFDCPKGVVPPIGLAYGVATVVDDSLSREGDLYFQAGDLEDLVHMTGAEFQGLVADARHGSFSEAAGVA